MNTLWETLKNPLFYKPLLSALLFISMIVFLPVLRRILFSWNLAPVKRNGIIKVYLYLGFFIAGIFLIRIWTGTAIVSVFQNKNISNLAKSGMALGMIYLSLVFIRKFINSLQISITKRHQYRKRAGYTATILYLIFLIPIWAGNFDQWATMLSVMGAGIALALHEVLLNIAGWFYILIRHPYRAGDRIELGSLQGDVIDISVMQTTLLEIGNWVDGDQSTGRVVHMPHGQIFRLPLYNYTQGFEFIWNELPILVTFESNWEAAKEILLSYGQEESREVQGIVKNKIDRMSREYLIYYKNFSPIVYTQIEESGVKLTLRYLTEAKKRRGGVHAISERVLKSFKAASDIEFAYPTVRLYRSGEDPHSRIRSSGSTEH